jgi:hypothetical protein
MVTLALASAGCFQASRSLLLQSDLAQPVRDGRWQQFRRLPASELPLLSDEESLQCTDLTGGIYCPDKTIDVTRLEDDGYSARIVREHPETISLKLSSLGDGFYVFEVAEDGGVRYDIARLQTDDSGASMFAVYTPFCDQRPDLHDLAPPPSAGWLSCHVPSRKNLFLLMQRLKDKLAPPEAPSWYYIEVE